MVVLDVDGTLAPLRIDPQTVRLSQSLQRTLARLAAHRSVALVSGRPLPFLQQITGELPLLLVGSHGAEANRVEFRPHRVAPIPAAVRALLQEAERQGVAIEDKPFGLVLHFRRLPTRARGAAQEIWGKELGPRLPSSWDLMRGNAVLEIRPRGIHKGNVVAPLRRFGGGKIAVVMGDDVTDEDMFRALRPGEVGVLVGDRRATLARFHLPGITATRHFLEALSSPDR